MRHNVVVDSGAIVGLLSKNDQKRNTAVTLFEELNRLPLTCEAVITESCFLMRQSSNGERQVLEMIRSKALQIAFSLADEVERVEALMQKYKNVPMSLADACLVRMSEIFDAPVFTFDSDFKVYRRNGKQRIPLIGLD